MANVQISPGVFTQEADLSFVPQGIAAIGGAIVGITDKGSAFEPIQITNFNDFRTKFGNLNTKTFVPYTAKNYLQNSNIVTIVRVLQTTSPQDVGSEVVLAFPASVSANTTLTASCTAMGLLRARSGQVVTTASISGVSNNFFLNINGTVASGLSMNPQDPGFIKRVLGVDPFQARSSDALQAVYVSETFDYSYFASPSGVTGNALATSPYASGVGGYDNGGTPNIVSQNYNGQVYQLFSLQTLSDGDQSNRDIKISVNVDPSQFTVSSYPIFTLSIRAINDIDSRAVVLETFTCNLDPNSNAYISRVIGDRQKVYNTTVDPPVIDYLGNFNNNSKYVRVVIAGAAPPDARPAGFQGVPAQQVGPFFASPLVFNHLNSFGVLDSKEYMGWNTDSGQSTLDRTKFLVTSISAASSNITRGILITALTSEYQAAAAVTGTLTSSYWVIDSTTGNSANTYNKIAYTVPVFGGWDGIDVRKDLTQTMTDGTLSADFINAIKILGNPDELDFNLITVPGLYAGQPATQGNIPSRVLDMVTTRGDAFYIMDAGDSTLLTLTGAILNSTIAGVVTTIQAYDTNYAATYFPAVRILDSDNNVFNWVPPSVVVMGAYAFNDKVGQPWFAPAGLNRGVLNVIEARKRLRQADRDTLYLGRVNPIATFTGQGVVIYGQKTLQVKASALDRVNVRRLLLYARKTISSVAKYFVFEPNTPKTRTDITNAINPILERVQRLQGLQQYKVVIDSTNNGPDVVNRNIMQGDIFVQPAYTAEIISMQFNITRTGATFGA